METGQKKFDPLGNDTVNSQDFINTVVNLYADEGKRWLASLPTQIEQCSKTWQLTDIVVGKHLSYHYIATAYSTLFGMPVIVKLGFDTHALEQEKTSLQLYQGRGCVRLLAADMSQPALLLERLVPGTSLTSLFPAQDLLAIEHTVNILKSLHQTCLPKSGILTPLSTLLTTFEQAYDALPQQHLTKAQQLLQDLLENQARLVVLHADLHQGNILQTKDGYTAIDPKGMLGDPAYDVGPFIRNPLQLLIEHEQAAALVVQRIERFAQRLSLDTRRIAAWCYVQSVIAACWHSQDNSDTQVIDDCIRMAELLESLPYWSC